MLFDKSHWEEIKDMPSSSESLQFFPSFFLRAQGSGKNNNKTNILQKLCWCSKKGVFKRTVFQVTTTHKRKMYQTEYDNCKLRAVISLHHFWIQTEKPLNSPEITALRQGGTLDTWKHFRVWIELLSTYLLPKR